MQKPHGNNPQEREAYWVNVINKARQYEEGVTAYCRDYNISKNSYYSWFKVLRPRHLEWSEDLPHSRPKKKKTNSAPETEVVAKATRRQFSAAEKCRILEEADRTAKGQIGQLLRREGIYTSHLKKWRKERETGSLEPKKRGPEANPLTVENRKLRAQNAKLEKKLKQAEQIIELQKKVSEILGVTLEPLEIEDED